MFLMLKKCDIVIQRLKIRDYQYDWDDNVLKAINYIYSAISNKQLEFVCEKMIAFKIIKKLDSLSQGIKSSSDYISK